MNLVIINSAVDSLYWSYRLEQMERFFSVLEAKKQEAEKLESPVAVNLGGAKLLLSGWGIGGFAYRLDGDGFLLKMSPKKGRPTLYIEPHASMLYEIGAEATFKELDAIARQLGPLESTNISRLDLCADFQGFKPTIKRLNDFICRANYKSAIWEGKKINGFQFGKGDVVARLYNKTKEIKASGKDWMEAVWERHPKYDSKKPVWRVEFQFRREALKQFDCDTVTDTFERLQGLFEYGLKWLSLREPKATRDERSPVDKKWAALSKAKFPGQSCKKVREKKLQASRYVLVRGASGFFSSLAASYRIKDSDMAWIVLDDEMRKYYDRMKTSFATVVQKKIDLQVSKLPGKEA